MEIPLKDSLMWLAGMELIPKVIITAIVFLIAGFVLYVLWAPSLRTKAAVSTPPADGAVTEPSPAAPTKKTADRTPSTSTSSPVNQVHPAAEKGSKMAQNDKTSTIINQNVTSNNQSG